MDKQQVGEIDGKDVYRFLLSNTSGGTMEVLNYGGIITSLMVVDKSKQLTDIVLGYDDLEQYLSDPNYFGALIGRYANRIGNGCFSLDGALYQLDNNDGNNHLHGGKRGFNRVVWEVEAEAVDDGECLRLFYESADGEEGYPGKLQVMVRYHFNNSNQLVIDYQATTDRATIICLTQHSYFNLDGGLDITDHHFQIAASHYTPVDSSLIPTGEIQDIGGTELDFLEDKRIGDVIGNSQGGAFAGGIDHNLVLDKKDGDLSFAAAVKSNKSGITLKMYTTEPGVQFYTGNFLDGTRRGKGEHYYGKYAGFCLEAQHFPDSPNHRHFPSVELLPHQIYRQRTIYEFTVDE